MPSRNSGERPKTGEEALQWLKVGNDRYVKSLNNPGNAVATRHELISEQDPFAIILGCSDARVPVEIVFDQGLGVTCLLFVLLVMWSHLPKLALSNLLLRSLIPVWLWYLAIQIAAR